MTQETVESKKLYYLEYSPIVAPLMLMPACFSAIGFRVQSELITSDKSPEMVFSKIKSWEPNIIVFCMVGSIDEPDTWIKICQYIREDDDLVDTKIMACLPINTSKVKVTYDFQNNEALDCVEYAKIAKQLVGEEVK